MPLDAIFLKAVRDELARSIIGMKIDRVSQPEHDVFILNLRGRDGSARLLISTGAGARLHLTAEPYQNPEKPSAFCMLLRKHLQGAVIAGISQPDSERVLSIELDAYDAFGEPSKKALVAELISRSENLYLIGPDGIIIDCLRRRGAEFSSLPGLFYELPPAQAKIPFLSAASEKRRELWESAPPGVAADQWLLDTFSGLSPLICRELSARASGGVSGLPKQMDKLAEAVSAGDFEPVMLMRNDEPFDFSFMPITQYGEGVSLRRFPDFSALLDEFFGSKERARYLRRHSADMVKALKRAVTRLERKLGLQREELLQTENRELARMRGDIITSNLHSMEKGMARLVAADYYTEGYPEIEIPLDPLKTPQQNAAAYYKEYAKAKSAEKYLSAQIEMGAEELLYLKGVLSGFEFAETIQDIEELRAELISAGYIKKQSRRERAVKPRSPLLFTSSSGAEIRVGRNNLQNEELTFRLAKSSDVWLHVQKIHGSHVVISCAEGEEPDDTALMEAATLAAHFSGARDGGKVPVDYTRIRYVRRIPRALPGAVYYTHQKTLIADDKNVLPLD